MNGDFVFFAHVLLYSQVIASFNPNGNKLSPEAMAHFLRALMMACGYVVIQGATQILDAV